MNVYLFSGESQSMLGQGLFQLTVTLGNVQLNAHVARQVPFAIIAGRTLACEACTAQCVVIELAVEASSLPTFEIRLRNAMSMN